MKYMRAIVVSVVLAFTVHASDLNLQWDQPAGPQPDHSNVYVGTAPGVYGPAIVVPFDPALPHQLYTFADGAMTHNARSYIVISAENAGGESSPSIEVSGFPRPVITDATPVQDAGFIRLTINGNNFGDGIATADIDLEGMTVINVNRVSANQIIVDYTVDPGTPNAPAELTVKNKWTDAGASFVASLPSEIILIPSLVPMTPVPFDVY